MFMLEFLEKKFQQEITTFIVKRIAPDKWK